MNAGGSGVVSFFRRAWRIGRWVLLGLVVAYIALLIYRIPAVNEQKRSAEAVAYIASRHLMLADIDGSHLPPPPDPKLVDATVAGVDANQNGIRDDVELAIFKKYPTSPAVRAAELQYALELQVELDGLVISPESWKSNAIEEDRGYQCIGQTVPRDSVQVHLKLLDALASEVEQLVFNTDARKVLRIDVNKFETSYSLPNKDFCDLNAASLQK